MFEVADLRLGGSATAGLAIGPAGGTVVLLGGSLPLRQALARAVVGLPLPVPVTGTLRLGESTVPLEPARLALLRAAGQLALLRRADSPARLETILQRRPALIVAEDPGREQAPEVRRDLLAALVAAARAEGGPDVLLLTGDASLAAHLGGTVLRLDRSAATGQPAAGAAVASELGDRAPPLGRPLMRAPIGEPLLELDRVTVRAGPALRRLLQRRAPPHLREIDLTLRRGESVGVLGGREAGKSLLLRLVAGLDRPSAGSMRFDRQPFLGGNLPAPLRGGIAMLFPDPRRAFNPRLPVGASLAEPLRLEEQLFVEEQADRLVAAVTAVGLPADALEQRPADFSLPQLQRLALARLLAGRPQLALLDEPLALLEGSEASAFMALLHRVRDDYGLTLLIASRDFPTLAELADRLVVLEEGAIVDAGSAAELAAPDRPAATRRLASSPYPAAPALRSTSSTTSVAAIDAVVEPAVEVVGESAAEAPLPAPETSAPVRDPQPPPDIEASPPVDPNGSDLQAALEPKTSPPEAEAVAPAPPSAEDLAELERMLAALDRLGGDLAALPATEPTATAAPPVADEAAPPPASGDQPDEAAEGGESDGSVDRPRN